MNKYLKLAAGVTTVLLVMAGSAIAYLYLTLCTGHPHGMC